MNRITKRDIRNKSRLVCGLTNILQYDAESLANDVKTFDVEQMIETIHNTKETLQNLTDVISEIEFRLYLDKFEES